MASLIQELFSIIIESAPARKKVTKSSAKSVYRRDYLRTRNRAYRKYEPEHSEEKGQQS